MPDHEEFNAIRISIASPDQIKSWSYGEVTKPETINYRTLKPEKDGLFCERIFGPTKDFECYCGKYKRQRYKGIICDRCGVEVARAKVRRERMGHISLAAPVAHIWFSKGTPSRLALLLDLSPRNLERVLYFAQYIVESVNEKRLKELTAGVESRLAEAVGQLEQEHNVRLEALQKRLDTELAELETQREAAEQEIEQELKASTEEAQKRADALQSQLEPLLGKKSPEDFLYYDVPVVEKEAKVSKAHLGTLQHKAKERVETVNDTYGNLLMQKRDIFEAEQEFRRAQWTAEAKQEKARFVTEKRKVEEGFRGEMDDLFDIKPGKLLSEGRYKEVNDRYLTLFKAGMGAEAIMEILKGMDLDKEADALQEESRATSGQHRKKAIKRLRVVEAFRKGDCRPAWMVLTVLPVLPPDLRPMVQLDGGRFATSDLNDLYRRVINRNNRLRRLLELGAPDIIIRNEKRMLQEAVDALIDNGRRGKPIAGSHNHKLKSLSDMLRGKQGRFRQNLLGKRVDYSGRSVIVVGPELKLHQCGLPKRMALELFKPFIMHQLVAQGTAHNIKSAKRMVERARPEVWDVLEGVIKDRPVLLNRAPTLHRLGIQAFEPILVEGSAIQIHPMVCTAFNADFDGDQMAVHVPLSRAAILEAKRVMLSSNNMLSPASGEPLVAPTLDMVLGCYYITYERPSARGSGKTFSSADDARLAYEMGLIDIQAPIKVKTEEGQYLSTTVGRLIFNEILPQQLLETKGFYNSVMDKKALKELTTECYRRLGAEATGVFLDRVKRLGFHHATISGITIGINDIQTPPAKVRLLEEASQQVVALDSHYSMGMMTEEERQAAVVTLWREKSSQMTREVEKMLPSYGGLYYMASSGAKGNISQITQMAGMRGLMSDPRGRIIDLPVKSSFREGLSVLEYFISTHGARKGLADTALRTADSGYLTRRLIDVSQDVIVREGDCGSAEGIWIEEDPEQEFLGSLPDRIAGRWAAEDLLHPVAGEVLLAKNQEILEAQARALPKLFASVRRDILIKQGASAEETEKAAGSFDATCKWLMQRLNCSREDAEKLAAPGRLRVQVRSALTCEARRGVCQQCYGRSLGRGGLVQPGEAVGIIAAQSIGEPGTQLTMRTFHTGGVAGEVVDITSGLPRVEELFEARTPKLSAILSDIDGVVDIEDRDDLRRLRVTSTEVYRDEYRVPPGYKVLVQHGDPVETGAVLAMPSEQAKQAPGDLALPTSVSVIQARVAGQVALEGDIVYVAFEEQESQVYEVTPSIRILVEKGQRVRAGQKLTEGLENPQDILRVLGREAAQRYMIGEVQKVYRTQGVTINDKHIEVIIRQMLRKVMVETTGDTQLLPGELIDHFTFEDINAKVLAEGGEPATARPVLLGVTKASLHTDSVLAKASFQETTRVLTDAAVRGETDYLLGLKENVIIGRLIPARLSIYDGGTTAVKKPSALDLFAPSAGDTGDGGEPLQGLDSAALAEPDEKEEDLEENEDLGQEPEHEVQAMDSVEPLREGEAEEDEEDE